MNGGWETGPSKIFSIYLKPKAYIKTQLQRERRPLQMTSVNKCASRALVDSR